MDEEPRALTAEGVGMRDSITRMLDYIGEDPQREGLRGTPDRLVRSWEFIYGGYKLDPKEILSRTFGSDGYSEMVMLRDIQFYSMCEHHMLPFFGTVTIGYVPEERVVGVSKLARVVDAFSRRLQIQERMTIQIADAIQEALRPKGVMVVVEARHLCMMARGVRKEGSNMTTSAIKGVFIHEPVRAEFFGLRGK
jgi:GTP cyclohydrolase IA